MNWFYQPLLIAAAADNSIGGIGAQNATPSLAAAGGLTITGSAAINAAPSLVATSTIVTPAATGNGQCCLNIGLFLGL